MDVSVLSSEDEVLSGEQRSGGGGVPVVGDGGWEDELWWICKPGIKSSLVLSYREPDEDDTYKIRLLPGHLYTFKMSQ